jgi:hypothetical protein
MISLMDSIRPTRAQAYFEQIKSEGVRFLIKLVGSPTSTMESEFLEFKGAQQLDPRAGDLPEIWAKCLSCFANSDGGVLIFGIHAPKGAAKSLSLVQDLAGFRDRLKELLPRITEPPVLRVEIETYREPEGSGTGFVVCHIPPSPWRPHQVRSEGQPGQFYIRATDNCIPCNHATLRALFAPERVAVMEIRYRTYIRPNHPYKGQLVGLACWLNNKGPATAIEPFFQYKAPVNQQAAFDHGLWEETPTAHEAKALLCKRSIHPGETVQVFSVPLGVIDSPGVRNFGCDQFTFRVSVSARDQLPINFEFTVHQRAVEDTSEKSAALLDGPF